MIQITLTFPTLDAAVKALREIPESALTGAPVAPESAPRIEYADLQKAVFDLVAKDRDAAAAVVKGLGVRTFKDLPAERWAEAKGLVDAALAKIGG